MTSAQLREERLKPAAGQQPLGYLRVKTRRFDTDAPLYDPAAAAKMNPLSSKQKEARAQRRTCPACGTVHKYIVRGRCHECRERDEAVRRRRQERTCAECGTLRPRPVPPTKVRGLRRRLCPDCRTAQRRTEREEFAAWLPEAILCPDCNSAKTSTKKAATAWWKETLPWARWSALRCQPCREVADRRAQELQRQWETERAEAEEAARERRRREVADLRDWARTLFVDGQAVILDTVIRADLCLTSDSVYVDLRAQFTPTKDDSEAAL
ncbi:hypothetical protein HEK616_83230 (plasmid) [Streptomyces nigrescens]|uniref:Uncharacterized protein n=1 Tax=Streptomyces nigrescens TaxID=1920 RepID=A0ABN6RA53_STRNI|nr:hypothetical protein [Streptomyces nigrescens]BDM74836.1 hypothetical protein HEK616_83230 [Streptomyces nigrescens]